MEVQEKLIPPGIGPDISAVIRLKWKNGFLPKTHALSMARISLSLNPQGLKIKKSKSQWEGIENGFPIIKIKEGSPHNASWVNEDIVEP
jgi:hypothetical protein